MAGAACSSARSIACAAGSSPGALGCGGRDCCQAIPMPATSAANATSAIHGARPACGVDEVMAASVHAPAVRLNGLA
jgi:hypothetical protein